MAPTEETILSTFLLPPATLPAIITLKSFTSLFPRNQQSSPQIRSLYHDLQHQRAALVDSVTQNIKLEIKKGNAERRAIVRSRRTAGRDEQDDEADVEHALFRPISNLPVSRPHTLTSILPEMESTIEDIEEEVQRLDEEAEALLEEMKAAVGGLSDLRYGRLANDQLREQILEGLSRLETSCESR